jgi:poly-gamma-glutamate synthesis protein (capsule biosynthesis protein)
MVKLCRFYAERGVSAIVSHHSHLISAYEVYKNVPIFYGLGNFIHAKENFEYGYYLGYALKLVLKKDIINFELIPYFFSVDQMAILKPNIEQQAFLIKKQNELNLLLNDYTLLKRTFGEEMLIVSETRYLVLLNGINNIFYKIFRKLHLVGLLKWLMYINKKRYFSIWNVLRCEHHQDIINAEFSKIFKYEN